MAIGHGELMHERFPKHMRKGTANEADEGGKKRGVSMEKAKRARKKSSDGLSILI